MKVLLLGGTGTIGRATAHALHHAGHDVVALVRPGAATDSLPAITFLTGNVTVESDLRRAFTDHAPDAVISCLASRTGAAEDAWNIDYRANLGALSLAEQHGTSTFVLLSAICVQKPRLAFQKAKLSFEAALQASTLRWSIVRPTAYFKSLSGQIDRLRGGKPFLIFGDGALTACKPISDRDLATFIAQCLTDAQAENRILPIGGPGPALTPRQQGELMFEALGLPPRFRSVPPALLSTIATGLAPFGALSQKLADKAEFARIGHYYATQSMLVWDETRGVYDADATPEFGADRLKDHFHHLASEGLSDDRGDHAVF